MAEPMTEERLQATLARIHYLNRNYETPWEFTYEPVFHSGGEQAGWLLQGKFMRPETHTSVVDWGRTRKEFVAMDAYADSVIKTCWVIIDLTERHEAMESFKVDGLRVFDPHIPLRLLREAESRFLEERASRL
jgi:hypothetical protein